MPTHRAQTTATDFSRPLKKEIDLNQIAAGASAASHGRNDANVKDSPQVGASINPSLGCHHRFCERPSAPEELLPKMVGTAVHSHRYSTFIREKDLRALSISFNDSCGASKKHYGEKPNDDPLINIFSRNPCPVLHLGYLASHLQKWKSKGTALGEVVYSLSLAPGESRNIAVIDLRRRQQGRRQEDTQANEQLISNQDHNLALQEVATAVALEHQAGKTKTEANTLVTGGAFVAAGALVGGVGGGVVGTLVEPGVGTAVGAAIGAGAGVIAGGLVFAGAQAIGMIESESEGDRDIMAQTNQRIAQSTSQQSALIRSLWSTVVTEDIQQETLGVRTSNITNYNHMHALNMEYYEILHSYDTVTELQNTAPILYLPFGALPLDKEELVDEFWDSIRQGLSEDLKTKGDHVFVEPPPDEFVPADIPDEPLAPEALVVKTSPSFDLRLEVLWDMEWLDLLTLGFDDSTLTAELKIKVNDHFIIPFNVIRLHDQDNSRTVFIAKFNRVDDAFAITSVKVTVNSAIDIFDSNGVEINLLTASGSYEPVVKVFEGEYIVSNAQLPYTSSGHGSKTYPWDPLSEQISDNESANQNYLTALAEYEEAIQANIDGEAAHEALLAQLAQWKEQVLAAVKREPYRFTMIILSGMEMGRLTWILDRLIIGGDSAGEQGQIPLHAVAHTTPIGISGDSVLLRMKTYNIENIKKFFEKIKADSDDESHGVDQAILSYIFEKISELDVVQQISSLIQSADSDTLLDLFSLLLWPSALKNRFEDDLNDLSVCNSVYLPGAGVFSEAVLGRSNAAEYVDPERYWNWQDSPIPHQAPQILPISTAPRNETPLPTDPVVPNASLSMASAPEFQNSVGLASVLGALQNGDMFRDMSKSDQLTKILGGLADLAASTANSAAGMTGDAASKTLSSATDIGKTVASLAQQLMSKAPAQAAKPPSNPTVSSAATSAIEKSQGKSADVQDATKNAWGIPTSSNPSGSSETTSRPSVIPAQPWRPELDPSTFAAPGQVSNAPVLPTEIQENVEQELINILSAAGQGNSMPDMDAITEQLEVWYRDSVVPLLIYARHNEQYLNSAIGQYLQWLALTSQMGVDEDASQMQDLHGDANTLITFGLKNAIKVAYGQMEANNDLDYISDVLNWIATADSLGLGDGDDPEGVFDASGNNQINPIHVVLSGPLDNGGEPLANSEQFDLTLHGGLAIGANPPLAGKIVTVAISVSNGCAVPDTGHIHPALNMHSTITRTDEESMTITVKGTTSLLSGAWEFEAEQTATIN